MYVYVYVYAYENVYVYVYAYVYVYVFVYVYVIETAARSKKTWNHCGRSPAYIFSTAQDSTAVSDGTGEERKDTHFAITEKK